MLKTLTRKIRKSKGGFTLIELIVVVAILAILAVVLVPLISGQIAKARNSANNSDAQAIFTATQLAINDQEDNGTTVTGTGSSTTIPSTVLGDDAMKTVYNGTTWKDNIQSVTAAIGTNGGLISVTITPAAGHGNPVTYPN